MWRVQFASGEEAVFRSVEELSLAIQSGMVTAEAKAYDNERRTWLPITDHPDYGAAAERAATLARFDRSEPLVGDLGEGGPAVAPGLQFPIYHMVSRSAAELAARKRTGWLFRAVTAGVGFLCVLGVALTIRSADRSGEARDTTAAKPPPVAPRLMRQAATQTPDTAPMSAADLAAHLAAMESVATREFVDSATRLGLVNLLSPGRLQSSDSLQRIRGALTAYRALVGRYRAARATISTAYGDSAIRRGDYSAWSLRDREYWRNSLGQLDESRTDAQVDSLWTSLDQLYGFLLQQKGNYDISSGQARFGTADAADTYERLRSALARNTASARGDPKTPTFTVLAKALRGTAPPATTY